MCNKKGTAVLSQFAYTYDANGNISSVNDGTSIRTYIYDKLNRLTEIRLSDGNKTVYSYDLQGNRKTECSYTNNLDYVNTSYSYQLNNQLRSATIGTNATGMAYYADGMRAKKTTVSSTTHYIYNTAGKLVAEASNTSAVSANYVWGPDRVLSKKESGGSEYYYLYNGHGDVIQIVDRNGNVVNNYKYDEWGNILESNETISNPFMYAGEVFDKETVLYYLRARYYDPAVGRFINEDSVEGQINNPLSLNLYTYCYNNPLMFTDPSGHKVKWTQWDNLYNGFSKTGQGILWDFVSMNFFDVWNSIVSLIDVFGKLFSGDIYSFQQYFGGDFNYVVEHWDIISDNQVYDDGEISYFGNRLAGAYAELLSLGVSVAGLAEFANSMASIMEGASNSWYKADGSMNYPSNNGAISGTEKVVELQPGQSLGRYGNIGPKSDFVTTPGASPDSLSLPPNTSPSVYTEIRVLKPIPGVIQSTVAPWGGSSGMGIQYQLPKPLEILRMEGYITY